VKHLVGVPANRVDLSSFEVVVLVQEPTGGVPIDAVLSLLVNHGLSVVLAVRFQIQIPKPVGGRIKFKGIVARLGDEIFNIGVLDRNGSVFDQPRIGETDLSGQVLKVVPVESTAETFSPQDLVLLQGLGDPPVGVDVGKVQLASRFQEVEAFFENGFLVGAEVDDAV
jgi:hypothetical protein